jgi:hypothetical protein
MECLRAHRFFCLTAGAAIAILLWAPASVAGPLPGLPDLGIGSFSLGLGVYQAPSGAKSHSGTYGLARYEVSTFELEVDYGLSKQNYFLGAADYLYKLPTAEGITQTAIAFGGGLTYVANDAGSGKTQLGPNVLAQLKFMHSYGAQLRYDFLGHNSNLWSLGVTYSIN